MDIVDGPLEPFPCPRCDRIVTERFWGPCAACRRALVAAHASAPGADRAGTAGTSRFEPAMHVVANHVATKD